MRLNLRSRNFPLPKSWVAGLVAAGLTYMTCQLVWEMTTDWPGLEPAARSGPDIHKFDFQPRFVHDAPEAVDKSPVDQFNVTHKRALQYLIEEPNICKDYPDVRIISYLHSAVMKRENRQLVRDTWGSMQYYNVTKMRVMFVFGAAATEEEQRVIDEESRLYHDIVQTDFVDSYRNLSYKGVSALQWVSEHCLQAEWILKSDDDMVINIFALVDYLDVYGAWQRQQVGPPDRIMCAVWWGMPVLRGNGPGCAKWCVSEEEWPDKMFPTYCSGSAFLIPVRVTPRIYHAYFHTRFLWVDDAYISGVLPQQAGVKHVPLHSLYELNHHLIERNLVHGNRLFCHHPGKTGLRARWWPLIAAKEGFKSYLGNHSRA